ncbi:MAG TPA: BON domain-containing protein [Steroidobacteraceae bacterium]
MSSSMLVKQWAHQVSAGNKTILAFLAVLTITGAAPGCAVFPRSSNPLADEKVTANVEARFGRMPELEAPNLLRVQTIDRVVYLSGTVATGLQRRDAEIAANQAQGVAKVINSIVVDH